MLGGINDIKVTQFLQLLRSCTSFIKQLTSSFVHLTILSIHFYWGDPDFLNLQPLLT